MTVSRGNGKRGARKPVEGQREWPGESFGLTSDEKRRGRYGRITREEVIGEGFPVVCRAAPKYGNARQQGSRSTQ